jgi:mannosylglycerate hydrolase MGH1-like protein/glycosyl hydrolase family 65
VSTHPDIVSAYRIVERQEKKLKIRRAVKQAILLALGVVALASTAGAQVLASRALLTAHLEDNRDVDWFASRVPIFESPDSAIDATYYYRWELVTKHLTYGSPETGYTFTEFLDRPFWSGAYGSISCPLGHQLDEIRWLNDPAIVADFARYWFETPGAQPRSYSNWYGAAMWGLYQVSRDSALLHRVLPYMKRQYAGWVAEHWDATRGMFHWDGLHDGMERNINSRQTDDIDTGADGFRPTLNSYLYADARAIARASALFGDRATATDFDARADSLRARVERELWDERRTFFLHEAAHDDKSGVHALTRTYETGKYAGNEHGRELIGYVPWQFDLPEEGKGYERAWRFLMDTAYFLAPYGPTTTERHDPQFYISPRCCWWSGNSWPYATTQTLDAMANLVNDYRQRVVSAADWMRLFGTYTRTQRKGGQPYVAEAANPDNGSWEGHDTPGHSNHYFHSAYVNLVITGVVGLRPRADDSVVVNPLAPSEWAFFALDNVRYHGRRLTILWDRTGTRYHRGRGLTIVADGRVVARATRLERLAVRLEARPALATTPRLVNYAVNNSKSTYPRVEASYAPLRTAAVVLDDGNYWYSIAPPNRWTTIGSPNERDTVTIRFESTRYIERIVLYPLDDSAASPVHAPAEYAIETWDGRRWTAAPNETRVPRRPEGHRANIVSFPPVAASAVRVILVPAPGSSLGLTELEVWGRPRARARGDRTSGQSSYGRESQRRGGVAIGVRA